MCTNTSMHAYSRVVVCIYFAHCIAASWHCRSPSVSIQLKPWLLYDSGSPRTYLRNTTQFTFISTLTTILKEGRCVLKPLCLEAGFFCTILAHKELNLDPHKISECFVTSFCWVRILLSSFPFTTCGSSDGTTEISLANPCHILFVMHTPRTYIGECNLLTQLLHPALQAEGWEGRADAYGG